MSEPLTFMMGEFAAEFPVDRLYAKNHMWAMPVGDDTYRFGFTAYAVRLLQDVYFIEFSIEPGLSLHSNQEFGDIESKKAESGLYAPMAGTLIRFNDSLLEDPSVINVDKYGEGWLMELHATEHALLTPHDYLSHLDKAWEIAQKTIKGQVNAD